VREGTIEMRGLQGPMVQACRFATSATAGALQTPTTRRGGSLGAAGGRRASGRGTVLKDWGGRGPKGGSIYSRDGLGPETSGGAHTRCKNRGLIWKGGTSGIGAYLTRRLGPRPSQPRTALRGGPKKRRAAASKLFSHRKQGFDPRW